MPLQRVGVIGDIHAEDARLALALAELEARKVELVVATGDVVDGRGSVDTCCALLRKHRVVAVCGNHDRWLLADTARNLPEATARAAISAESAAFLAQLPRMVELETVRGRALLCHGLGPNDMGKVGPDDFGYALETNEDLQNLLENRYYRWIINGHSHRRMVRAFPRVTIVNAGTLKAEHSPCFLEIDFTRETVLTFDIAADSSVARPPTIVPLG